MADSGYNYKVSCKHCGTKPFSEGPHHEPDCARHRPEEALESDLALSKKCRYCGVRPFIAGAHHPSDCRRFFSVETTGDAPPDAAVEETPDGRERISLDDVLGAFTSAEVPLLTVEEVAATLECSLTAAHGGLVRLVDRGDLYRKRVGAESEVFLLVRDDAEP